MSDPTLIVLAAGRARRYGGVKQLAPVGQHGEAVIDLTAADAITAGFRSLVLVVNPETGPAIEAHVKEQWPDTLEVAFAVQDRPLGTVHAVLAARHVVDPTAPFGVANADDLYGADALRTLHEHLRTQSTSCLVGFRLRHVVVGEAPVTRGVCTIVDGRLTTISERRQVHATPDGFVSDDGLAPRLLDPDARVSMNLWGFRPAIWELLVDAMARASSASEDQEVLLPIAVGEGVRTGAIDVDVLASESRCIGVTHAEDLAIVQQDVLDQIRAGERSARPFAS